MSLRAFLAVLLTCVLLCPPAAAIPGSETIGQLSAEGAAELNGVAVPKGATVFAGDRIEAKANSTATVSLAGGNRVLVTENSRARVRRAGSQLGVTLERGTVGVLHAQGEPLVVEAAGVLVRPASSGRSSYLVRREAGAVVLTAVHGDARVEAVNTTHVVPAGKSMRFTLGAPAAGPQGPVGAGSSGFAANAVLVTAIVLGAAAAIIIPVVLHNLDDTSP
jgi:ferric-dicitrate binding protein FerR (iron transport regulator)